MQNYSISESDEEKVIDYGEITVPTSWDDITLKTFQEIERYYADTDKNFNVIDVIDILIDKDRDFIMTLPEVFLSHILENQGIGLRSRVRDTLSTHRTNSRLVNMLQLIRQ